MNPQELKTIGQSLRERKLSNDDVQESVERVWSELKPKAEVLTQEVDPDFAPRPSRTRPLVLRWGLASAVLFLVAGVAVQFWPRTPQATVDTGGLESVSGSSPQPM